MELALPRAGDLFRRVLARHAPRVASGRLAPLRHATDFLQS